MHSLRSYQYKEECESLEHDYNKATEEATMIYNKKRMISGETKVLKQNQSTTEKYESLKKEYSDVLVLHSLWKLQVLQNKADQMSQGMQILVRDISNINEQMDALNSSLNTKKALSSSSIKDCLKLTKAYDQKNDSLAAKKLKALSLDGQKKHLEDNLKNASHTLSRANALYEKQARMSFHAKMYINY